MYDEGRIQRRNFSAFDNIQIISPGVVTSGLALNLDAGNYLSYPAANTKWYDLTDKLNAGDLTNGPTFTTENGGAIVLDGTNDFVAMGGPATLNLPYASNELWVKLDSPTSFTAQQLIARQNTSLGTFTLGKNVSNRFFLNYRNSSNTLGQIILSSYTIPSTWLHIVISYDGETAKIYINNALEGSLGTVTGPLNTGGTFDLRLGYNNNNTAPFPGKIAIFRIYDRAISPMEIEQNFYALRARFGV
jgi:hypothetical protein